MRSFDMVSAKARERQEKARESKVKRDRRQSSTGHIRKHKRKMPKAEEEDKTLGAGIATAAGRRGDLRMDNEDPKIGGRGGSSISTSGSFTLSTGVNNEEE